MWHPVATGSHQRSLRFHLRRLSAFAVDAYLKLFCMLPMCTLFLLLLLILCIVFASYAYARCRRRVAVAVAAAPRRVVGGGAMARHLHATYKINYYALSPPQKSRPFAGQNLQHGALLRLVLVLVLGLRLRHWRCMSCTLQLPRHSPAIPHPPIPIPILFPFLPLPPPLPLVAHYGDGYVAGKVRSLTAAGWPTSTQTISTRKNNCIVYSYYYHYIIIS